MTGEGEGKTRAATLQAITVNPGDTVPTGPNQCYPGQTCDGHLKITNPNGPLVITTVALANPQHGFGTPSCPYTFLNVVPQSGLSIPPRAGRMCPS